MSQQLPAAVAAGLATRQHGVVATYQLRAHTTADAARHELSNVSRWVQVGQRVYRSASAPITRRGDVMAGLLAAGPGACVSHTTAAFLWSLGLHRPRPVHITRVRATNSTRQAAEFVAHEARRLHVDDVVELDAIAVTTPARTLIDVATTRSEAYLERLVDQAWSKGLVDFQSLMSTCCRLGTRGRPGVAKVQRLVEQRGPGWVAPASNIESRLQQLLSEHGMGDISRQVNVGGRTWLGRVDFLHPCGLIIEVQSERYHAALSSRRDDEVRFGHFEAAGYQSIEVWDTEIWARPSEVVDRIRRAILGDFRRSA